MKTHIKILILYLVLILPAQAKADKEFWGRLIGTVAGAAIGHDVSNGNPAGTVVGGFIGGIIGNEIVNDEHNRRDRRDFYEAGYIVDSAFYNPYIKHRPYKWHGPRYSGNFYFTFQGYISGVLCRRWYSEVYRYNGTRYTRTGISCLNRHGRWYLYSNRGHAIWDNPGYYPPQHNRQYRQQRAPIRTNKYERRRFERERRRLKKQNKRQRRNR